MTDVEDLRQEWLRSCRADPELNRFPEPSAQDALIASVALRVTGAAAVPDAVLAGHARGFSVADWDGAPELRFRLLAKLVSEASRLPNANLEVALRVMATLGDAALKSLIEVWRGEAEIDSLTSLGNRRRMEASARSLTDNGLPFEYASIDVDGLKAVNDVQGHPAGDALLTEVASAICAGISAASATAFRYGGDEFGVIRKLGAAEGGSLGEELAAVVEALRDGVGFSFGIAVWPSEDPDFSTVAQRADKRMYEQKEARRAVKPSNPLQGAG